MSDERDIARMLRETPLPEDGAERRMQAVDRAMGARARRRRRRRAAGAGVLACLLVAGGAYSVDQALDEGSILPGGGGGATTAASGADLAALPWVSQPEGARTVDDVPPGTGAIEFPPGTSYEDAASALYLAVTRRGALPVAARTVGPLPRGVVLMRTAGGALRLALAAPFGYDPVDGLVTLPSLAVGPDGVRVELRPLPECEVRTEGRPGPDCPYVAP